MIIHYSHLLMGKTVRVMNNQATLIKFIVSHYTACVMGNYESYWSGLIMGTGGHGEL